MFYMKFPAAKLKQLMLKRITLFGLEDEDKSKWCQSVKNASTYEDVIFS